MTSGSDMTVAARRGRSSGAAVLVLFALFVSTAGFWGIWSAGVTRWPPEVLRDLLFWKCVLLVGFCAAALSVVVVAFSSGRARRSVRPGPQEGVAMLEFALVLPIALMIVLVMAQSSLLLGGNLCVHYASYCAARTAIVTIPEDLPYEPANQPVLPGGAKWNRIRQSAVWAVLPVACGNKYYPASVDAGSLAEGLGEFFSSYGSEVPAWASDVGVLSRKLSYASDERYTEIGVEQPRGASYGPDEDITVNVRHTYYLAVPYASWLFAEVLDAADGVNLDFGPGQYGLNIYAKCTLQNQGAPDGVRPIPFW